MASRGHLGVVYACTEVFLSVYGTSSGCYMEDIQPTGACIQGIEVCISTYSTPQYAGMCTHSYMDALCTHAPHDHAMCQYASTCYYGMLSLSPPSPCCRASVLLPVAYTWPPGYP